MQRRNKKSSLVLWGAAMILALLAVNAQADPIQDGALAPYRAGWFSNAGPHPLTCADTCKAKAPGSIAEHEASAVPPTKRAFVCRVAGKPEGHLETWLYGSQFDDRAACYTTGLDLKGSYNPRYFCLCVVAAQ
ncbi:MAG TPA: hypothetical protein VFE33_10605 [Thermoanaerobaculia bacterium]|nr:hypothetical protein [Thermoanaerobaculia bacterium]